MGSQPSAMLSRAMAGAIVLVTSLLTAVAVIGVAGPKPTWLVLIIGALGMVAVALWSPDLKRLLLLGYIVTLPVSIGKTVFVAGDGYWQTLAISLADVFLYPYLVLVLLEKLSNGRRMHRPVGLNSALVYTVWMWVTAMLAQNVPGGALAAFTLTKAVIVYIVIADQITTPRQMRQVLIAFSVGLLIQIPIIAGQWLTGTGLAIAGARSADIGQRVAVGDASAFRPPGLMRHPNELADYPLFLLPTALLLLIAARHTVPRRVRLASIVMLVGGGAVLVISLSRGAWIAGAVTTLFTLYVGRKRGLVRARHVRMIIGGGILAVLAAITIYPAALQRAIGDDQRSTQVRLAMFQQAELMIRTHPIAGIGLGGYYEAAKVYVPASFGQYSAALRQGITGNVVHNKYLLILAEHGIVGLIAVLGVYVAFFREWRATRHWLDDGRMAVALGLTSSLVAQLVFYAFEHFYFGFRTEALWFTYGLLAAIYRMERAAAAHAASEALADEPALVKAA